MVKTKAPLLSLAAGGQIGKVLTASNWKGRTYLKKLTVPANPNTAAQVGVRQMLRWLSQHWSIIPVASKATWTIPAAIDNITNLDAYIRANLKRWTTGHYPGEEYPILETGGALNFTFPSASAKGRGVQLAYTAAPFQDDGGATFWRSTSSGFTPHYTNAIVSVELPQGISSTYLDTPLDPGVYYYRMNSFSKTGKAGSMAAELNATVT